MTRARIGEVHEAHEKTFQWLFDPAIVSFADWLQNPHLEEYPIYWIQGKPGSGKSTLMKFAMRDSRLSELLSPQTGGVLELRAAGTTSVDPDTQSVQGESIHHHWTIAAFFFHDRGSEMQKALIGMLQEILVSILRQVPALLTFVMPFFISLNQTQRKRKPKWDFENLQSALIAIVTQRKVRVRILFLLDALDEHSGDNEQLASLLEKLVKNADNDYVGLKMCLASRSWNIFRAHFDSCPGFAIHEYTKSDIFTYATSRLRSSSQILQSSAEEESLTAVIELVTDKALGVFIWVRLVVDILVKGIRDGTPLAVLEIRARDMPQELKDLYAHTLRRIEPEYTTEAYIMLQTALCSLAPLPLKSFMGSLDYNYDSLSSIPRPQVVGLGEGNVEESLPSQVRRLASRSGGLLEIVSLPTSDRADGNEPDHVVQFVHQTVKDYVQRFQHELGLREVLLRALEENGHVFLLRACAESQKSWVCCIKRDLFAYAKHVDDINTGFENDSFADQVPKIAPLLTQIFHSEGEFGLLWWLKQRQDLLSRALGLESENDIQPDSPKREKALLRLAVAANLLNFIATYQTDGAKSAFGEIDLLHVAAAGPDIGTSSRNVDICQMVRIILDKGYPVDWESFRFLSWISRITELHFLGHTFDHSLTPLALMLSADKSLGDRDEVTQLLIARILFQSGANANTTILRTSLVEYCVRYRSASFVRLLLEHRATLDPGLGSRRLLSFAYFRQDQEIIRTLHDFGVARIKSPLDFHDNLDFVSNAVVATSGMWAAPSGGVPTLRRDIHGGVKSHRFPRFSRLLLAFIKTSL